ncbi:MAG: hypothetical protein N3F05_04305 [Candidatus Diapherotrites archaeon]|nr:hypothetical protein [Candidatus Diapherotrites archaeon]
MDKKNISFILIGIVFGIEGVLISYFCFSLSSEFGKIASTMEQEKEFFDQGTNPGFVQILSVLFMLGVLYGIAKTIIGIFCIATGASELFEGKALKEEALEKPKIKFKGKA